jgi:hypothetical protein
MANRYGEYEEKPGRWQEGRRDERGRWRGEDASGERESDMDRGGRYGLGGPERGYNMGGYGGMSTYEQGYTPRSYDRMLDLTEGYYGAGDEDYGRARAEDERYWYERNWRGAGGGSGRQSAGAVGMGREPFSDEWTDFDRFSGEQRRGQEPLRTGSVQEWRARSPGQGKAPKGYSRSDARIREDVCERLMYSPYDSSDVEVTVSNGEVTLTGTVRRRAEKWGIEDVAGAVLGVHDVHNQLRIVRGESPASDISSDDTERFHS